jgi:hypothetical protein
MIRLLDLISLAGVELGNFKIHCATPSGDSPTPLEAFFDGHFQGWQEYQTKQNFRCDKVLSLIHLGGSQWLFAGVYAVSGVEPRRSAEKSWYQYSTVELPGLEHLAGRAVVQFYKNFRASYLRGDRYGKELAVCELRRERLTIGEFPGYRDVLLSYRRLRTLVRQEIPSWRFALSSVSGVYVIVDTLTGRQYVGSACGSGGIWQRWVTYALNGHGENKDLKVILQERGAEYSSNFQYAILEISDLNASPERIEVREDHWKRVLRTREFGYNRN